MTTRPVRWWPAHESRPIDWGVRWWCDVHGCYEPTPCHEPTPCDDGETDE